MTGGTQITIQEYKVGETIKYQDLRMDSDCDMCMHENHCMTDGKKFRKYGDDTGRFIPEQWNEKQMYNFYRKFQITGDVS